MIFMNVLVMVHDMIVPNRGGGAPRTDAVARAFSRAGHNVTVFAPVGVSVGEAEKFMGCSVVPMRHVSRNDPKKILKYGLYNPLLILRTIALAKRRKIGLIWVHDSICGFPAFVASKLLGIPFVLDATDFIAEYIPEKGALKHLAGLAKLFENRVIRGADRVITVSRAMESILLSKGARDVAVVYDGVNSEIFHPCRVDRSKEDKSLFRFVYQGGMDVQDGLEILVPAAERVLRECPKARILLVGDGKMVPKIREEAAAKHVSNAFEFTGWVPYEDVAKHISRSDAGLVIMPDIMSARIRVTLKTFEYWACGKPIIVAKLPALSEIISSKTGLFYDAGSAESLAGAMVRIYKDRHLHRTLTDNGVREVRRYEWRDLAEKIVTESLEAVKSQGAKA